MTKSPEGGEVKAMTPEELAAEDSFNKIAGLSDVLLQKIDPLPARPS